MFILSNEAAPAAFEALRLNFTTFIFGSFMVFVILILIATGIEYMRSSYIGGAFLLVTAILIILFMPFNAKYYQVYQVVGTVEKVSTLASSGNNNVKLNSVLVLDNVDRPIYMGNEPLVSTLEVGDTANLLCTIEYSISINDKYHCVIKEWVEN